MAVRAYSGPARPISSALEGNPAYRSVEWDHADASIFRGYEKIAAANDGRPLGALVCGACVTVSPARQAVLDAENVAKVAAENAKNQFLADCQTLYQKARAHAQSPGSNPALTTRETNEAIARLFRLARQLFDLQG